ncbi:MAG: NADPH-dependent F420 reductase [Terracidiphilus sp.]|jgi:predicted dinucleotide-binding enzyme
MKIGIIGTGKMGTGLAKYWAKGGHELMFSFSHDEAKLRATAASIGVGTRVGSPAEAAEFGDVVLLATPYSASAQALREAGPLRGKVLFSCVNALKPDLSGMAVGTTTSGAEELSKLVPEARFVEALPPFAEILHTRFAANERAAGTTFYCGNDPDAKSTVAELLREIGVDPIDAGPLTNARFLEPAMMLLIQLAYPLGMGPIGLKLILAEE